MDRNDLEQILFELVGNENVYFQPPTGTQLKYPCIVFRLLNVPTRHANNKAYHWDRAYQITHIYKDYRKELVDEFLNRFKLVSFDTRFTSNNMYHDVYTIYW